MTLEEIRKKTTLLNGQRKVAVQQVKEERELLFKAEEKVKHVEQAQKLAQELAQHVQEQVHNQIAGVVSRCLATVFQDDPYEFRLVFEQKRGKTEARPVFIRNGHEVHPVRGAGGGASDVASFALRILRLVMAHPQSRLVLFLDEPLKFLSADYVPMVRDLIKELSTELGVQFVIVTHDVDLQIGKVITIE